jgi:hypothetical protein
MNSSGSKVLHDFKKTERKPCSTLSPARALIQAFIMPSAFTLSFPRLLLSIASTIALCQCASTSILPHQTDDGTYWSAETVSGPTKIVISLQEQLVGLFKGGRLVGLSPISSGREGYDTYPGSFRVTEKDIDHRSSLYGAFVDQVGNVVVQDVNTRTDKAPPGTRFVGADMRYFMRINGAIGMHQGYLPGYPASHGCIRLSAKMAPLFFDATPQGTPVEIQSNAALQALRPALLPPEAPVVKAPQSAPSSPRSPNSVKPRTPKPLPVKAPKKNKPSTLYLEGYGPQ